MSFEERREAMVARQIAARGVRDPAVLAAMRVVPRERFVGEGMAELAYEDSPLAIGEGQTISQPYIVAAMIEAAEVGSDDRVLEVGAGSGYAAAVLAQVAGEVFAIDRHVRHLPARSGSEPPFQRFPTWMWRNIDVAAFIDWLRRHNAALPAERSTRRGATAMSGCATTRAFPASCWTCRPAGTRRCAGGWPRRGWSGSSA